MPSTPSRLAGALAAVAASAAALLVVASPAHADATDPEADAEARVVHHWIVYSVSDATADGFTDKPILRELWIN